MASWLSNPGLPKVLGQPDLSTCDVDGDHSMRPTTIECGRGDRMLWVADARNNDVLTFALPVATHGTVPPAVRVSRQEKYLQTPCEGQ